MINYEFKITISERTSRSKKYEIFCNNQGVQMSGSLSSSFVQQNITAYYRGTVTLKNVGFTFGQENSKGPIIQFGDYLTIEYRTNFTKKGVWNYLFSGAIGIMEDSDNEGGDFDFVIPVNQIARNSFFSLRIDKNFQGKTIKSSLEEVLGSRLKEIVLPNDVQNKVIDESFYCNTVNEFLNRIQLWGGFALRTDFGSEINTASDQSLFIAQERSSWQEKISKENAKNLEKFGLHFIPQQDLEYKEINSRVFIYWNATTLLTNKINVGDTVSFRDRLGEEQFGVVLDKSYSFSTRGACTTEIRFIDQSSYLNPVPTGGL